MSKISMTKSSYPKYVFIIIVAAIIALTFAAAQKYSVEMAAIPEDNLRRLDTGWNYEEGSKQIPVKPLPCKFENKSDVLVMNYNLAAEDYDSDDVLIIETRYQAVRVWADDKMVYESERGKEYALSSMWHAVPAEKLDESQNLRVELTKYDDDSEWQLMSVYLDRPSAIAMYIIGTHLPAVLIWIACMMLSVLLFFISAMMAAKKIEGIKIVLSLGIFIFLSGMWLLLDSKITTLAGGNYSMTYFFSYCIFYTLPIPLIVNLELTERVKSRALHCLTWIIGGNAFIWMLLHYLNVVSIRSTTWSVHVLIVLAWLIILADIIKNRIHGTKEHLGLIFWGILIVFAVALGSIVMYYTGHLKPTNNGALYAWGIVIMILCMTIDTVLIFEKMWIEKQQIEIYRQLAVKDRMTGLFNRNAYELYSKDIESRALNEVAFINFDIDNMKNINDTHGHHAGDRVIMFIAECIDKIFNNTGKCFRIGGDEFCVIVENSEDIPQKLRMLDELIEKENKSPFPVSVSYGWAFRRLKKEEAADTKVLDDLKKASDKVLYQHKRAHKKS